jgi:indolepyruvate ferredoxin oxidoreductase beta subunit
MKGKRSGKGRPTDTTNIVISGVGGQGVLTLASVIAETAMSQGLEVTTAEVHGLAMRFGHLEVHLRMGKKIHSPLVPDCGADIVIGLEPIETLRASRYIGKDTAIVFDTFKSIPIKMHLHRKGYPDIKKIVSSLKTVSKRVIAVDASETTKKETGTALQSNIYLLGLCVGAKMMPLDQGMIMKTLELLPRPENNIKMFKLGVQHSKKSR